MVTLARPGMLWFAAFAVLPLLVHLWNRQRAQHVAWGAMRYLLAAAERHSRRIQIRHWFLLSIRTLILLLLALALSDPHLSSRAWIGSSSPDRPPTHFVVVLDGSYSMLAQDQGRARMQTAREQIERWLEDSVEGDGFTLLLISDPPRVVIGRPAYDPRDVRRELQSLDATHASAQLDDTLIQLDQLLDRVSRENPQFGRVVVGFFTDLEAHTWQSLEQATTSQLLTRVAGKADLQLFDVGAAAVANAAVTQLEPLAASVTRGNATDWEAVVENLSSESLGPLVLHWLVDDQSVKQQVIRLAPGEIRTLQHQEVFTVPGQHHVCVSLEDDALEVDNLRWQGCQVHGTLRVLCVEGRPDEARHLKLALDPGGDVASPIQLETISIGSLIQQDLAPFQLVWLCNVARFSAEEAGLLRAYVQRGGCLVFLMGDQVQQENYNQLFTAENGKGLLPGRLQSPSPVGSYRLDPLQYRHPLLAVFAGQPRAGLRSTPIYRYQTITLPPTLPAETQIALALENGEPLLLEHMPGEGRVLFLLTSVSPLSQREPDNPARVWSDLSSWPSFLPLVQELLVYSVAHRDSVEAVGVGDAVHGTVPVGVEVADVLVRGPSGRVGRLAVREQAGLLRWSFTETQQSGLYWVSYDEGETWPERFVVNVNPAESALARIEQEVLPAELRELEDPQSTPQLMSAGHTSGRLFQVLLAALVCLLLAETWLGYRLGRRTV